MRELLSKTNLEYQERAREVAEKYVRPRAAELDRTGEYGWDILEGLKSAGLTGIWIPEEYDGQSAGVLDLCLVVEQLSRACGGVAGGTYIFCVPGSPGACKDAWDGILQYQLDNRHRPCNFVEIMPRLLET